VLNYQKAQQDLNSSFIEIKQSLNEVSY
jgi:hypothetical protein